MSCQLGSLFLQQNPVSAERSSNERLIPSNSTCHADYVKCVFLQIESDLDSKLPLLDVVNSSFPSWAARNLSAVLLPPLPPVVPPPSSRSRPRERATPLNKPAPAVKKGPKRPSLRYFEEHFILFCMEGKQYRKILFLAILSQKVYKPGKSGKIRARSLDFEVDFRCEHVYFRL